LSNHFGKLFGRELDPLKEIIVTVGATEGLFAAITSVVDVGDEVILIEPFYDTYPGDVVIAGGKCVYVPLRYKEPRGGSSSKAWRLDMDELQGAITPKTKMIIINNPSNVPGKVWLRSELEGIATIAKRHNLVVLSDEVYEAMVFDDNQHVRIATLPGMWERTITLGSAGKTWSVTGWKVGWAIGPHYFWEGMSTIHQFTSFSHATPLQEGIAIAFENADLHNYFPSLKQMYQSKRNKLIDTLRAAGLSPVVPDGSYFVLANTNSVDEKRFMKSEKEGTRDYQFARWLTKEIGVAAIPPTAFYCDQHKHLAADFARFTFCKRDEVLDAAAVKFKQL